MSTDPLRTARLDLEPVSPAHADEMVGLLADRALYAFYADEASPSLEELRERYARQAAGVSPDGRETWHSWILRERGTARCVGFVQATVRDTDLLGRGRSAELAWVVGTAYQGRGFATEAAAVLDHLAARTRRHRRVAPRQRASGRWHTPACAPPSSTPTAKVWRSRRPRFA
jgi:RimJ/RimL family protein N-acetyltransferase